MNRFFLLLLATIFNLALFSCTDESVADTESLFEIQSTEGDDGETDEDPDGNN